MADCNNCGIQSVWLAWWPSVGECRCRPHLLHKLWGCTADCYAPDPIRSRRLQSFFPHRGSDEGHNRKGHPPRV